MREGIKKIIFIRRDNIGDLVCTTPAIRAVRKKYPEALIGVLVNSYNADVISGNPDVDEVYIYEKAKHRGDKTRLKVYSRNLLLLRRVRGEGFDVAIGCSYGFSARLARYTSLTGAPTTIGFAAGKESARRPAYSITVPEPAAPVHEVEAMMRLVGPLGISGPPPALFLAPDEGELKKVKRVLTDRGEGERVVALHISSRKPANRWLAESFAGLADLIQEDLPVKVLLLWSPGDDKNPLHPGDDGKAERVAALMKKRPVMYRTERLKELIGALAASDMAVCSDGGAMHIAAGLNKPVLTVWGTTDERRWAPWGVDHLILKKDTGLASSVSTAEGFGAFKKLFSRSFQN